MLTCHDARALIVRTIDDPLLPGDARAALRMHLAGCASCLDEYETQHEVRRVLALHIEEPLPAGFAERLNARLAQEARLSQGSVFAKEPNLARGAMFAQEPQLAQDSIFAQEPIRISHDAMFVQDSAFASVSTSASASVLKPGPRLAQLPTLAQEPVPQPVAPRTVRWRMGLRLLPIAATIALIVADAQLQRVAPIATATPATAPPAATSPQATIATGSESNSNPNSGSGSSSASASATASESAPGRELDPQHRDTSPLRRSSIDPQIRHQVTRVPTPPPLPSSPMQPLAEPATTTAASTSTAPQRDLLPESTFPVTIESVPHVASLPIVSAPDLAEALKLSDTQRKQIDAAIEKVLTPDQRRLYRERQANPEGQGNSEGNTGGLRNASERSSIRPRPTTPILPPTQQPVPPPW